MTEQKRLANKDIAGIETICPFSDTELEQMNIDYIALSPVDFGKKYRYLAFRPSYLKEQLTIAPIQMNFCTNPFCKWYAMPQEKFINVKSKPSRYRLTGAYNEIKRIICNEDAVNKGTGITLHCWTDTVSNWSVAEEIKRLITINTVIDVDKEYEFHYLSCPNLFTTPFDNEEFFYRRGKSKGNSQRWQCRTCKKITHVLPTVRENFNYNQNKNDILPLFAELLVSRTPVKRSCEILHISPKTYYHKLEWLYRKCLEFLQRHETKAFEGKLFDEIWLNTDKLIYFLNNIRRKGKGGIHYTDIEESRFQTQLIASSDLFSRYVFRADIAYDFDVTQEEIEADTVKYHDDHLYSYARKNDRLRLAFAPQPPTPYDHETKEEYEQSLSEFLKRKDYIDGMHTNSKYTSIAHYWLIQRMLKCSRWNFVSDEDASLMDSIFRVFAKSIKDKQSHYFLCKLDRSLSRKDAYNLYKEAKRELRQWAKDNGKENIPSIEIQKEMISEALSNHSLYDYIVVNGQKYPKRGRNPIKHPLPSINEGIRWIDCVTDLSSRTPMEIADYLVNVNSHSINTFFNKIRRSLSILERPLVTARGDGKSYIYSNYNPKYAQYAITILRTFYNFCWAYKTKDGDLLTPAQRIGITNRRYTYAEIIYFS